MALHWFVLALLGVSCVSNHTDTDIMTFVNDTLPQLCPYNDFCQTPAIKNQDESSFYVPCCSSCSCNDD